MARRLAEAPRPAALRVRRRSTGGPAGAPAGGPVGAPAGGPLGGPVGGAPGGPPRAPPRGIAGGGGIWISASPLNPADVGSASSAGNSSTRTYLSGSSIEISNSMGTRLLPRMRRVRPDATSVLRLSSLSPPSALRTSASTLAAFSTDSGLGAAAAGAWGLGAIPGGGACAMAKVAPAIAAVRAANPRRQAGAMVLPVDTAK